MTTRAGHWTWITEFASGQCDSGDGCAYPGTWSGRGDGSFVTSTVGARLGSGSPGAGVGSIVFLLWSPGTWGEPMLMDGHFFSLSLGWLVGWCHKWPLPSGTDERGWTELFSGKRGMVWAGGSPGSSEIVVRLTLEGESGLGGTPAVLATNAGGRPWISLDPRCPGLSGTGEPLFYECWTACTSDFGYRGGRGW